MASCADCGIDVDTPKDLATPENTRTRVGFWEYVNQQSPNAKTLCSGCFEFYKWSFARSE